MSDADLALSILTKVFASDDGWGSPYVKVWDQAAVIDGHIDGLTTDEVALLRRMQAELRQ